MLQRFRIGTRLAVGFGVLIAASTSASVEAVEVCEANGVVGAT